MVAFFILIRLVVQKDDLRLKVPSDWFDRRHGAHTFYRALAAMFAAVFVAAGSLQIYGRHL